MFNLKNSLSDDITIKIFIRGAKKAVRSHAFCIRGLNLMWDGFLTKVHEINNLEPQKIEVKLLNIAFAVKSQKKPECTYKNDRRTGKKSTRVKRVMEKLSKKEFFYWCQKPRYFARKYNYKQTVFLS